MGLATDISSEGLLRSYGLSVKKVLREYDPRPTGEREILYLALDKDGVEVAMSAVVRGPEILLLAQGFDAETL